MRTIVLLFIFALITAITFQSKAQTTSCQAFGVSIITSLPAATLVNGVYQIQVCPGDSVYIEANGNYPNNDIAYHQSDSLVSFHWNDQYGTNYSTNNTFVIHNTVSQIISLTLAATDTNNCTSDSSFQIIIVVTPSASLTVSSTDTTLCLGDSTTLVVNRIAGSINNPIFNKYDTTYLPDGSGITYTSSIYVSGNQIPTIQSITALSIWASLEHSYLGDLHIMLECPNGQSIILKPYPSGSSTYLGEPIDNNAAQIAGIGYEYHWSAQGTTTMLGAAGTYNYSYTNALGVSVSNHSFLPPSYSYPIGSTATGPLPYVVYTPEDPLTNLVGCPTNGDWTIKITDNLAIDNGFIFGWGVDFGYLFSSVYQQSFVSQAWSNSNGFINTNSDSVTILPSDTGMHQYTYSTLDNYGCIFDSNYFVKSLPIPEILLGNDTTICANQTIELNAGPDAASILWSNSSINNSIYVDSSGVGIGSTELSVQVIGNNGCKNNDTIIISFTDCTSINDADHNAKLEIYPNPSSGVFNISGNLNTDKSIQLQIFNSTAKLVLQKNISSAKGKINRRIDLSDFPKGIYYLRLNYREIDKVVKIIVK